MKKHAFICILFVFLLLIVTSTLHSSSNMLTVHFIDVEQGDSILIVTPDMHTLLVDTGGVAAGPKIVKYLKAKGVKKIDHLVTTHSDEDHLGGFFSVLSQFQVNAIHDNGFGDFDSPLFRDYIRAARSDLSRYGILQAGESFIFGNITIHVLNPLLPPTGYPNPDSIVLRIVYGKIKILLAGDLEKFGERRLISSGIELSSQIFKVGHHGDDDCCSDEFLDRIHPEIAIISVGKINRFARPGQRALNRLSAKGARIFRTDRSGNIVLNTDGTTYSISTER